MSDLPTFTPMDKGFIEDFIKEHYADKADGFNLLASALVSQVTESMRRLGPLEFAHQAAWLTGNLFVAAHSDLHRVDLTERMKQLHPYIDWPDDFRFQAMVWVYGDRAVNAAVDTNGEWPDVNDEVAMLIREDLIDCFAEMGISANENGPFSLRAMNSEGVWQVGNEADFRGSALSNFRAELDTPIHEEVIEEYRRQMRGGDPS